ncbi:copper homeostasis membrane protein CopD [Bradyrhizobium sp. RDM4]|uniref:copper homeostasis membrane protein CopD n=1 Tax=Bradyrhizobium sp. RDM4 TaxID=3378765 RepID=UPI0038FC8366
MSWFGAEIDVLMIATRTVHFAASAITAGALIFRGLVAEPALRAEPHANALVERQLRGAAWIGIAVVVVSGLAWVLLLTMSLSGEGVGEAVISGALRDVLQLTQFGWVSQVRLALAIMLSICLAFERSGLWRLLPLGAAASLVASIAWTGHAASTPSGLGYLHLASDALHLIAAAVWFGGLIPLVLLLRSLRCHRGCFSLKLDAVRRFSTLAIISVATLTLSGFVNAWILVGSFRGLVMTDYGQLLILKLSVFAVMLVFAAINRLVLTPQLASLSDEARQGRTLRALSRNTLLEIALGLSIFSVVGVLGMQHPAAHLVK